MDWETGHGIAMSHHFLPGEWNEVHPYEYAYGETDGPFQVGLGRYLNSESADSVFGGLRYENGPFWAEGGVVSGYSGGDFLPFGRVGYDLNDYLSAFAAPAMTTDGDLGAVVGLNFNALQW